VRRGDVYGVVLVPRDFARDLKRGRSVELPAWYNAQFLPVANVVSRDLQSAAAGFGAALETRARLARGETRAVATVRLNPIAAQRTTLFNPQLNYGPFLVTGIAAALLHMAAMLAAVRAIGRELRSGHGALVARERRRRTDGGAGGQACAAVLRACRTRAWDAYRVARRARLAGARERHPAGGGHGALLAAY